VLFAENDSSFLHVIRPEIHDNLKLVYANKSTSAN
jgi:hypothetical protein